MLREFVLFLDDTSGCLDMHWIATIKGVDQEFREDCLLIWEFDKMYQFLRHQSPWSLNSITSLIFSYSLNHICTETNGRDCVDRNGD